MMPTMSLEEKLHQKEEITKYLDALVEGHKRALWDETLASQLDNIREHITICFSDLSKLNDDLISHNGSLKTEMLKTRRMRDKIVDLSRREIHLLQLKKDWNISNINDDFKMPIQPTNVTVDSNYRVAMNKYIEMVGINNTSLSFREEEQDDDKSENGPNREVVMKSLGYLHSSHTQVQRGIKLLESLLKEFKKDNHFLESEIKLQSNKIRSKKLQIDEDLENINNSRKNILQNIGLQLPEEKEPGIAERLFNLKLHEKDIDQLILEADEKLAFIIEFIDFKLESLNEQLNQYKNKSSILNTRKNSWLDCVQAISALEEKLRLEISKGSAFQVFSTGFVALIEDTVSYLNDLFETSNDGIIKILISDEKETLVKACHEFQSQNNREIAPVNNTLDSFDGSSNNVIIQSLNNKNNSNSSDNNNSSTSNPAFLSLGKSPPKIGISQETIASIDKKRD